MGVGITLHEPPAQKPGIGPAVSILYTREYHSEILAIFSNERHTSFRVKSIRRGETAMPKPKIDAKSVLDDMRAGLGDAALMQKYNLSAKGLQSLFGKLVKSGLLDASHGWIDRGPRVPTFVQAPREVSAKAVVSDIRSGLTDRELMTKYRLSGTGVRNLFEQLLQAGLLKESDLDQSKPSRESTQELGEDIGATLVLRVPDWKETDAGALLQELLPDQLPSAEEPGLGADTATLLITDEIKTEDVAGAEVDSRNGRGKRSAPVVVQEVRIDASGEESPERTVAVVKDRVESGGSPRIVPTDQPTEESAPSIPVQEVRIAEEPEHPAQRTTVLITGDTVAVPAAQDPEVAETGTASLVRSPGPAASHELEPATVTSRREDVSSPLPPVKPTDDEPEGDIHPENQKPSAVTADSASWRCPACGMPQSRVFNTCPVCGIEVAKYLEVKRKQGVGPGKELPDERPRQEEPARAERSSVPPPRRTLSDRKEFTEPATAFAEEYRPEFNPERLARTASLVAVIQVLVGLALSTSGIFLFFRQSLSIPIFLALGVAPLVSSIVAYVLLRSVGMALRMLAVISAGTAENRVQLMKISQKIGAEKS